MYKSNSLGHITVGDIQPSTANRVCPASKKFSIIITVWVNALQYLLQCLSSVNNQTYFKNNDYQIIIGCDGCIEQYMNLHQIVKTYNGVQVYYNHKNVGTYILTNSLISKCKYDNIIRFDVDDIMFDNMVQQISKVIQDDYLVRFKKVQFDDDKQYVSQAYAHGSIAYTKNTINKVGGYYGYRVGCDTILIKLCNLNGIGTKYINKRLFKRRKHLNGLTKMPQTNMKSKYRKQIKEKLFKLIKFQTLPLNVETCKLIKLK